jgi:hypothetical protein
MRKYSGIRLSQSCSFLVLFVVLVLVLSGCKTRNDLDRAKLRAEADAVIAQRNNRNSMVNNAISSHRRISKKIQLGQSKVDVLRLLQPAHTGLAEYDRPREAFLLDGKSIEIHYFRSAWVPDGNMTDDEFTPYTFVDGSLTAIGWQSLGGAKTFGDTASVQRRNAARNRMLLGVLGLQQQQNQYHRQQQNKIRTQNQQRMNRLLTPPKPKLNCRTQYFGSSSRTVCD